jgi:Flp pilus assembly protein TadD
MDDVYELFQRGTELLEAGDSAAAAVPLAKAAKAEPGKASVREALGRAFFKSGRFGDAAEEFRAVTELSPTNDYALFCLGRALQMMGRHAEARRPLTLACGLRPGRRDYQVYLERARRRAA